MVGLVADLLTVPRDIAPLVELALGDAAQRFVVRDALQVDAVAAAVGDVAGRVGFVPLARAQEAPAAAAAARLDFQRYQKEIEPIFLKQREGLVKCVVCHAGKVGTRLRLEPLASASEEEVVMLVAPAIQRYLVGTGP